ncbi:phage tail protein [Undibacterium sp.]|uniref:phage tail protein n=1 Tax=Undibacterium sp. TaxID=1914977 RepID=UPI00374CB0D9
MLTSTKAAVAAAISVLCVTCAVPASAGDQPYLGEIECTGASFTPIGFLPLDGRLLSIAENDALFTLIGTTYGGDGQTTFALPDMRGRAIAGLDASDSRFLPGSKGGREGFALAQNNVPAHTHGFAAPGATAAATAGSPLGAVPATRSPTTLYAAGNTATLQMASSTTSSVGNSSPVSNMKPFVAVTCFIAVQGIFPTPN